MSTYIDTRDLLKRKDELESLKSTLEDARQQLKDAEQALADITPDDDGEQIENDIENARDNIERAEADFGSDEEEELEELENLESEISDFRYGETMIPEHLFTEYAEQLAEDCGMKDANRWPFNHIDWDAAVEALKQDYTTVTYQGNDYLVRA